MKTTGFLPVGIKENNQHLVIERGEIVKLVTGDNAIFLEQKRTKWVGIINGKPMNIPVYRDRFGSIPFIVEKTGEKDKSVIIKSINPCKFKVGDLFFLDGHKETFMFINDTAKKGGKPIIVGLDLASGRKFNIDINMKMIKIDLNKIKKDIVNA
jgi:hypothetical protein